MISHSSYSNRFQSSPDVAEVETQSPITVVLVADEGFALPLVVALYSILDRYASRRPLRIVVLDAGLTDSTKARIERVVAPARQGATLDWMSPDPSEFTNIRRQRESRYNDSTYYRLLIPDLLPDTAKAIYLDADVLLHTSLEALWEEPMEGAPALAVQERTVSCPVAGVAEWERLGLDPETPYMNSGVLVLDLEQWRKDDLSSQVLGYLLDQNNRFIRVGDQEALNAVLQGRWKRLDPRWNALFYFPQSVRETAHLSHFAEAQPWRVDWRHSSYRAFFEVLKRSGWMSGSQYTLWMGTLHFRRGLQRVAQVTRPLRHRLGLQQRERT